MKDNHPSRVFVVMGGCWGDEHIIAIYRSERKARKRRDQEDKDCKGLLPWVEEWELSK